MSKPRKGYRRKSFDLKEKTIKKIQLQAIKEDKTPKEIGELIIENHFNTKQQ